MKKTVDTPLYRVIFQVKKSSLLVPSKAQISSCIEPVDAPLKPWSDREYSVKH